MKVLKHLARDLNVTTHSLRIALRKRYGNVKGGRWRWPEAKYQVVLKTMRKALEK